MFCFVFLSKVVHFVYQLVSGKTKVYIFFYNVSIVTLEAYCNFIIKMKAACPLEFIRYTQYNLFLPKICSSVVSLKHSIYFKILARFLINILSVDALSFIFFIGEMIIKTLIQTKKLQWKLKLKLPEKGPLSLWSPE